jgi:hypothetical protein
MTYISMLDREPPGCPLDAAAVISMAFSLLLLAISLSRKACSSVISPAEKFRSGASAPGISFLLLSALKLMIPFQTADVKFLTISF